MIPLPQFIADSTGKTGIGDTSENSGQCVGLVEKWIDNLGLPHIWGNAIDLLTNADRTAYTVIYNSPTNSPSAGDIVVFKPNHTAVVVKADINSLTVFEQNDHDTADPTGACQEKQYTYENVVGWIHPNNLPGTETIPAPPTVEQVQSQLQNEIQALNDCQSQSKQKDIQLASANQTIINQQQTIETLVQQKADLQKQLDDVTVKYTNEQNRNIALNQANATISADNQDKGQELLDTQHEVTSLKGDLTHIAAAMDIAYTNVNPDTFTNTIITHIKTLLVANQQLQKQNNLLKLAKTGVAQTTGTSPASPKISLLQRIQDFFLTQ